MLSHFEKNVDNDNLSMNLKSLGEGCFVRKYREIPLPTVFFEEQELPLFDNVLVYSRIFFMELLDNCCL